MNEHTTQLLEKLATKLGTTSEYLWNILIEQAPISATIYCIQILIVIILGIVLYKLHKKFIVKGEDGYTTYDKYKVIVAIPMLLGFVLFCLLSVLSLLLIEDITHGFFNPEYWALKEVLNTLSPAK